MSTQSEDTIRSYSPPHASPVGKGLFLLLGFIVGVLVGLELSPEGFASVLRQVGVISGPAPAPLASSATAVGAAIPVAEHARGHHGQPAPEAASIAVAPAIANTPNVQPVLINRVAAGGPLTVGVFGDSMADGLWAGLYRQLHQPGSVDVVRYSQPSTGLTRYDYVNVQAKTEAQLNAHHVDIAVVMFGTNDQQGIVDGGAVYAFGTPGWRAAYSRRIDNLIALFRQRGVAVYWVGLPRMRKEGFDERANLINSVFRERMAALGVPYVTTAEVTEDGQGHYAAYMQTAGGKEQLMRAPDGVHMTMAGYLRMAMPVEHRIRADIAAFAPKPKPVQTAAASAGPVSAPAAK